MGVACVLLVVLGVLWLPQGHDLSLYAEINDGMLSNLTGTIVAHMNDVRKALDSRLSSAQTDVDNWAKSEQPKLTANQAEIAKYKAEDEKALNSVQKSLYGAQQTLANAQSKVSSLQVRGQPWPGFV